MKLLGLVLKVWLLFSLYIALLSWAAGYAPAFAVFLLSLPLVWFFLPKAHPEDNGYD